MPTRVVKEMLVLIVSFDWRTCTKLYNLLTKRRSVHFKQRDDDLVEHCVKGIERLVKEII